MVLTRHPRELAACLAVILAASSLGGCATKKFVRTEVGVVDTKLQATQGEVTAAQGTLAQHDAKIGELNGVARDALQRAEAAGKLAQGKFTYSVLLQDDAVKFPANGTKLSPEAQERLSALAEKLKTENQNVYIEVQGHTDANEAERLGAARAEAARRFLNEHGVPLNRIATISYGKSTPVAPNGTRAGRAQNRRVVVMVLS